MRALILVFVGSLTAQCITRWYGRLSYVEGVSMRPTLNADDRAVEVVWIRFVDPADAKDLRGRIVVFEHPKKPQRTNEVKRLVGLPGDAVFPLATNDVVRAEPVVVPPGHVWVESDARFGFADSNVFGPIERTKIKGRVDVKFSWSGWSAAAWPSVVSLQRPELTESQSARLRTSSELTESQRARLRTESLAPAHGVAARAPAH